MVIQLGLILISVSLVSEKALFYFISTPNLNLAKTLVSERQGTSMGDLDKNKKEKHQKNDGVSDEISRGKKLDTLLILLYQAYLKGETDLEPEIKASIFRRVNLNQEFALKIRILQSDYFDTGRQSFQGDWSNELDVLFPLEEPIRIASLDEEREETISTYKKEVLKLLQY